MRTTGRDQFRQIVKEGRRKFIRDSLLVGTGFLFTGGIHRLQTIGQTQDLNRVRLLVRGDDMGISHATNRAIIQSYKYGLIRSTEVIVPAPWFSEAIKLLKENPDVDVGVHLVLTSEWESLKWRPLTKSESLTDNRGYFYPVIWPNEHYGKAQALASQNWELKEIESEFRKQIELAKSNIQNITHISYHMRCDRLSSEVAAVIKKLTGEYNLCELGLDMKRHNIESISFNGREMAGEEKIAAFIKKLKMLEPGDFIFKAHPALDTSEMRAIHMKGYKNVASDRQGITDLLTSQRVQEAIQKLDIKLISYSDLQGRLKRN